MADTCGRSSARIPHCRKLAAVTPERIDLSVTIHGSILTTPHCVLKLSEVREKIPWTPLEEEYIITPFSRVQNHYACRR